MTSTAPNILWLCTDQQRWDTLGCYGNTFVRTPHLDQLAQDGVVFEHCYAQSPVCTPSRASFLTGRYPRTNGCRQNGQALPDDEVLVTKLLTDGQQSQGSSRSGYVGGLAGKLHIAPADPNLYPHGEPRRDDGYSMFHWSHHPAASWPTNQNQYTQWLAEHDITPHKQPVNGSRYVYSEVAPQWSQTTWCAQKAIDFIDANAAQPWFFSVNFFDPHHPFDPPRPYLERYLGMLGTIPPPNYVEGELDNKPVFQRIDHHAAYNTKGLYPFATMTAEDHALVKAAYWAMIDQIDHEVGRILAALRQSGQWENTIVIFMSDHGEMLGDHGIYLKGPYFYDPAVRLPLIVSWPGVIAGGRRSNAFVELIDIAPTLLEAVGREAHAGMQGRSFLPLLRGDAPLDEHRTDVYCEYLNAMPWHTDPMPHATMLRTRDHKIVAMHRSGGGELYDLRTDPGETHNRWDDPGYRDTRLQLTERLLDRIALTADPLPARIAPW